MIGAVGLRRSSVATAFHLYLSTHLQGAGIKSWAREASQGCSLVRHGSAYSHAVMKILILALTISVAGLAARQQTPISTDEVTLRHRIYGDGRVTAAIHSSKSGEIEHMTAGTAGRWTNAGSQAHLIVVTTR